MTRKHPQFKLLSERTSSHAYSAASRSRFFREQGYSQVTRDVPLSKATLDAALKALLGTRIPNPPHWKYLDPQRCVVCAQTLKRSQT